MQTSTHNQKPLQDNGQSATSEESTAILEKHPHLFEAFTTLRMMHGNFAPFKDAISKLMMAGFEDAASKDRHNLEFLYEPINELFPVWMFFDEIERRDSEEDIDEMIRQRNVTTRILLEQYTPATKEGYEIFLPIDILLDYLNKSESFFYKEELNAYILKLVLKKNGFEKGIAKCSTGDKKREGYFLNYKKSELQA